MLINTGHRYKWKLHMMPSLQILICQICPFCCAHASPRAFKDKTDMQFSNKRGKVTLTLTGVFMVFQIQLVV